MSVTLVSDIPTLTYDIRCRNCTTNYVVTMPLGEPPPSDLCYLCQERQRIEDEDNTIVKCIFCVLPLKRKDGHYTEDQWHDDDYFACTECFVTEEMRNAIDGFDVELIDRIFHKLREEMLTEGSITTAV